MEEIYQITSALKHLSLGKQVAVLTDARFSGVSTGACIGHVGPEALAGGPDRAAARRRSRRRSWSIGSGSRAAWTWSARRAGRSARRRARASSPRAARGPTWRPTRGCPDDTRLWAALQHAGGGAWGGCVYDVDAIVAALKTGSR